MARRPESNAAPYPLPSSEILLFLALGSGVFILSLIQLGYPAQGMHVSFDELFEADPDAVCCVINCSRLADFKYGPWNLCSDHIPFKFVEKE